MANPSESDEKCPALGQNDTIALEGVSRSFGDRTILKEVSLRIRRGELFGLLGPSGSGKTTLIKLITGIDAADDGQIRVLGYTVPSLPLLGKIGYMAQSDALYGELTAKENLAFFGAMFELRGVRLTERIGEVLSIVGLAEDAGKLVSRFSGGMKRRLSLAVTLLHQPELLILDEPTVGIDPTLRVSIWASLLALRERGTTILLTTHVMDEAERCDRIGLIRDGSLTAVGSPADLKARTGAATIEEAFIRLGGERS
ncbi:ABC transporter ATP-binding protein [Cohnella hashimotonis]|uniref:ABC transporter ATP-binding protein n=1 Tax=Cohnella hashimotonis TaxID=2826895 RepID=A0ABT6TIA8_9BACL|nr:ABC transporter ATP-binding protein [Cohnella hashimotonis]MDI4646060.1 ABC transporter ATP-binding protein [Cohnella hashimotonis]